jgi:uncharacterized heparinase superfamily protein
VLNQSIEYHLLANHLLANAKALFFAGAFFANNEPNQWLEKGFNLLREQIDEQILDDGGHFERSPMYHAIILEDLLDIVNIGRTFGIEVPNKIEIVALQMLCWLDCMTHPDGMPAHFNDSVSGVAALDSDIKNYADRLGIANDRHTKQGVRVLSESGYVRFDRDNLALIVDVGEIGPDYQPGHAHCDCLSFELSLGGKRCLVNTGVSTYNNDAKRRMERSTAAHNTVSIPGMEQSEIWSAFRVGRRARPFDVDVGASHVYAAQDGYRSRGIVHRRHFNFCDNGLEISDDLEAGTAVTGIAHFHCHPDVNPEIRGGAVEIDGLTLLVENAQKVELLDYGYCAGFNDRRPAKKISVTFESTLRSTIRYENSIRHG